MGRGWRHPLTCIFHEIKSQNLLLATWCTIYYKQGKIPRYTSNLTRYKSLRLLLFSVGLLTLICCQTPASFRSTYGTGKREDGLAHCVRRTWKLAHRQHPSVCLLCMGNCQYYCGFLLSIVCPKHITLCLGVHSCESRFTEALLLNTFYFHTKPTCRYFPRKLYSSPSGSQGAAAQHCSHFSVEQASPPEIR